MQAVREYLRHAEECERLAAGARDEIQKQTFLEIAQGWRKLAREREQHLRRIAYIQGQEGILGDKNPEHGEDRG